MPQIVASFLVQSNMSKESASYTMSFIEDIKLSFRRGKRGWPPKHPAESFTTRAGQAGQQHHCPPGQLGRPLREPTKPCLTPHTIVFHQKKIWQKTKFVSFSTLGSFHLWKNTVFLDPSCCKQTPHDFTEYPLFTPTPPFSQVKQVFQKRPSPKKTRGVTAP